MAYEQSGRHFMSAMQKQMTITRPSKGLMPAVLPLAVE